jgi:hypothetical protein
MALNIALCDDIMELVGKHLETRRAFGKCLKTIEYQGFTLEPKWWKRSEHPIPSNIAIGESCCMDYWNFWEDAWFTDYEWACDMMEDHTKAEIDESILYKWSSDYRCHDAWEFCE